MALCTVSGTVYLPNGQPAKSRTVTFHRLDRNVTAAYLGVLVPDTVVEQTDSAGLITVQLVTGVYGIAASGVTGRAIVPDAATADFADIVDAGSVPATPPVWYQQALGARDEAVAAADSITGLEVATGAAGTDATYADGVLTVPRGDQGLQGVPGEQGEPGPVGPAVPVVVTATLPGSPDPDTFYVVTG